MAPVLVSPEKQITPEAKLPQRIGGIKFDMFIILLTSWFVGGLHLDGWAHSHIPRMETFFTPWHGVLYSGYFACAAVIVAVVVINRSRGYGWREAIPVGYELSLLGVPLFLIGGVADMTWHILFGIEVSTEALLSPTHLLLAFSGVLIVSGPFRAAWRRTDSEIESGWATLFPMLMSFLATYSIFTFFTEYAHPFVRILLVTQASTDVGKSLGVAGILLQTALFIGFVLLLVKRWQLPFGALTGILTVNTAMVCIFSDQYRLVPAAFVAGLVADLLIRFLKPSPERQDRLRLFAFLVPVVLYLGYFSELMMMDGITWTIHFWLGSCVLAGIVGLLLSYVLVSPQRPAVVKPR